MHDDTGLRGPGDRFPLTRRSVVIAAGDADPEVRRQAWEALVASYWRPVYKYLRVKWREEREDAEDLTQGFFAQAFQKGAFERYDPAKARFRTFLRTCLDGFAVNERKAARRLKRGGGQALLSLDFAGAEEELARYGAGQGLDMEEYFHREWVRSLFGLAVADLRSWCGASGKAVQFFPVRALRPRRAGLPGPADLCRAGARARADGRAGHQLPRRHAPRAAAAGDRKAARADRVRGGAAGRGAAGARGGPP